MKFPSRRPALSLGLVGALAAIIVVLGILQVHWTGQVSRADRDRMQASLETGVSRFRRDFYLQLLRICWAFQSPDEKIGPKTLAFYADRYDDWMSASARPDIVAGLFVWDRRGDRLIRLDPADERFTPVPWPSEFASVRHVLNHDVSAELVTLTRGAPDESWMLFENSAALFHPFVPAASENSAHSGLPRFDGGLIVTLNLGYIWHKLVPELVGRYLRGPGGSDYRVAIISGGSEILYQSSPAPRGPAPSTGDVVENLIGGRGRNLSPRPAVEELQDEKTPLGEGSQATAAQEAAVLAPRLHRRYAPLLAVVAGGEPWRLVVRHRSGSVEAAVASLRRRNLAVSLGVLLLLAISMALIVVSAQRAHRLATLQMDFVAGVSHELRTPLAVICSAAENLADGIVGAAEDVKSYGALIRGEGRRLSEMVGQILAFAAGQGGRRTYKPQPLDVAEVVEAALANIQPMLDAERVAVEKNVAPGSGIVLGDAAALVQCIQNLLSNAIKYGGENRWVGVRSERVPGERGEEVRVTVEDHGLGIDPQDLPHIFEPFYRGKNGSDGHVHGTGLGLSLAKDVTEAMGGRMSVETMPGRGSRFTLHLPALEAAVLPAVGIMSTK